MARTRLHNAEEAATILRDHSARGLTPEQSAHELGVTVSSLRRYLEDVGGRIATVRFIVMPAADNRGDSDGETDGARARAPARAR